LWPASLAFSAHAMPLARIALHDTNLARATANLANARAASAKADAKNWADLEGLKAVNANEEATYRDYLSSVAAIAFSDVQDPGTAGIAPMVSDYKQQIEAVLARDAERDKASSVDEFFAGKSDWDNEPVEVAWDKLTDGLIALVRSPSDPSVTPELICP
jgi:hypothetical protein